METITTNGNNTYSKESTHEPTNKEDLMNLSEQYSDFKPSTLDCQGAYSTIVINEAFMQGMSATYCVTVQNQPSIALLDTGANLSVSLQKTFQLLASEIKSV